MQFSKQMHQLVRLKSFLGPTHRSNNINTVMTLYCYAWVCKMKSHDIYWYLDEIYKNITAAAKNLINENMFWGSALWNKRDINKLSFTENNYRILFLNTIIVSRSTLNNEWNIDHCQDTRIKKKLYFKYAV